LIECGVSLINVTFTKREDKNTFNRIEPISDRELFTKKSADVLESFWYKPENTKKTALSLLSCILDYDYSRSKGYLRAGIWLTML
jgi:hypothetical protein